MAGRVLRDSKGRFKGSTRGFGASRSAAPARSSRQSGFLSTGTKRKIQRALIRGAVAGAVAGGSAVLASRYSVTGQTNALYKASAKAGIKQSNNIYRANLRAAGIKPGRLRTR